MRIITFRTVLLSLGLSCFGAVLGQLFVSYFPPNPNSVLILTRLIGLV
jgi:hypothetical protein